MTRMSRPAEACTARSIKPFQSVGFIRPIFQLAQLAIGCLDLHRKYHPVKDFDKEGWKKRQLFTEYYTANLHVGAFMLPKYVEDILEEEEGKNESFTSYYCGALPKLLFQRFVKIAKHLQRL